MAAIITQKTGSGSTSFCIKQSKQLFVLIAEHSTRSVKVIIEIKFIKYAYPVISNFLSDIFNRWVSEGIYRDSLKITEVIPIF